MVTKTHSFDPETSAVLFNDEAAAVRYLRRLWYKYLAEELKNESELNSEKCYIEDGYGRVEWCDGSFTEFTLCALDEPDKSIQAGRIEGATFTSVWDGGLAVTTGCKVDQLTGEVFDIGISEDTADLVNMLEEEFVTINGHSFPVVSLDYLLNNPEDLGSYWYSN
ncbi:MAG: hypothetical protein IJI27_05470 [Oscillospiraceae bacterium]|nr:hypothetical protein [Oscillospiraceae bacterium]